MHGAVYVPLLTSVASVRPPWAPRSSRYSQASRGCEGWRGLSPWGPTHQAAPRRTRSRVHGHLPACASPRRAETHEGKKRGPGVHPASSRVGAGVRGGGPCCFPFSTLRDLQGAGNGAPACPPEVRKCNLWEGKCRGPPGASTSKYFLLSSDRSAWSPPPHPLELQRGQLWGHKTLKSEHHIELCGEQGLPGACVGPL